MMLRTLQWKKPEKTDKQTKVVLKKFNNQMSKENEAGTLRAAAPPPEEQRAQVLPETLPCADLEGWAERGGRGGRWTRKQRARTCETTGCGGRQNGRGTCSGKKPKAGKATEALQ